MGNAYRSVLALKPTGDAVPANVLAGKTFSNAEGTGKTGTMVNNGAVSVTLTDQDPTYTIPEGYHNGSGVVGFSASGGDGADLIVTCSSVFAGATISCTDGTTTYQKTCPSSSPFEVIFDSIPVGTWTISGTAEGTLFSTQFTVVDFETALNAIPEGSTVIPTDDVQTWLHCANIWDKAYTTISEVLADASTLQALIASTNANDYLVRSTSWATAITTDQSAMSYIGLNDYCSNLLLADTDWSDAICNSTYFESVLTTKVPTMTDYTTPSGVVTSSGENIANNAAWKAFNDSSEFWQSTEVSSNTYIQYEFTSEVLIKKVTFKQFSSGTKSCDMYIKGANDGTFSTLETITISLIANSETSYNLNSNTSKYKKIRLQNVDTNGTRIGSDNRNYDVTPRIQFYGRA